MLSILRTFFILLAVFVALQSIYHVQTLIESERKLNSDIIERVLRNGDLSFENYSSYRVVYEDSLEIERHGFLQNLLSRTLQNKVIQELYSYYKTTSEDPQEQNTSNFKTKESIMDQKKMICDALNKVHVRFYMQGDSDFQKLGKDHLLPSESFLRNETFNTCAVVGNAGSLIGSNLGGFIDSHDVVVRLNHAKTEGYEVDVGSRTDIRIVNSFLLKREGYNYFDPQNKMYQSNKTIYVTFEVSLPNQRFENWSDTQKPFLDGYFKQRLLKKDQKFYMMEYKSLWSMQHWLSSLGVYPIKKYIPSSGFIAFNTMLGHCNIIRLFEFIPTKRQTDLCHYFESYRNIECTYAGDHSLSAEKLSYYFMGNRDREEIFDKGFVTIDRRHCV